jgi:hypothetical protein
MICKGKSHQAVEIDQMECLCEILQLHDPNRYSECLSNGYIECLSHGLSIIRCQEGEWRSSVKPGQAMFVTHPSSGLD